MLQLTLLLTLSSAHFAHSQQTLVSEAPLIFDEPVVDQKPACPVVLPLPSNLSQRVVGGQLVEHDDLLFQAWLSSPARSCSATRLSKHWVLTAAHCDVTPMWNIDFPTQHGRDAFQRARIETVYHHPDYTAAEADPFDFALLRIVPPPSEPPNVHFVRLNAATSMPLEGAFVRVSGYGLTSWNGSDVSLSTQPSGEIYFVDVPVHRFSQCNERYSLLRSTYVPLLDMKNHMCVGYEFNRCNLCFGDSGGPFLQYDTLGRAVQVAVVSWTFGCALPKYPGVGLRVSAALPWFKTVGAIFEIGDAKQEFGEQGAAPSTVSKPVTSDPPASETPAFGGANENDEGLVGAIGSAGRWQFPTIMFVIALLSVTLGCACFCLMRKPSPSTPVL